MNLIKLSWKNLRFRPLGSLMSLILFALGVGLISLLFLVQSQLQENFEKNLAKVDLVIGAKGSPLQLILSSMYHIDAPTGNISIDEIRPFLNPKHPLIESSLPLCMGDSYRGYRIVGTDTDMLDWYEAEIAEGAIWEHHFEVVIGDLVAKETGLKIGSQFQSSHGLEDAEDLEHEDAHAFEVVGIMASTGSVIDQLILTTPQSYWLVHDHEEEDQEGHHIHSHDEEPLPLLEEDGEKEITGLLLRFKGRSFQALNMQRSINENTDMQAATPAIEINRLFSMMDSGEQVLRALALIIIFVSGLSVFISLFSSLKDRQYELALMRTMGGSPRTLFSLIIWEGLILAVFGYVMGIILSHVGMEYIGAIMKDGYKYHFTGMKFLREEAFLLVGALVIGFIAAVIPAIQASKTDIADTLSSE